MTNPADVVAASRNRRSTTGFRWGGSVSYTNRSGMAGWSQIVVLPGGSANVWRHVKMKDSPGEASSR